MNLDFKTRFLIVDDLKSMRFIIIKRLKEIGFENFLEASDGDLALKTLKGHLGKPTEVQFVISDWNMPNMLGIDLLKSVRADEKLKELPFLMVTAEAMPEQMQEAVDSGADDYAFKPFTPEELKEKILNVYSQRFGQADNTPTKKPAKTA